MNMTDELLQVRAMVHGVKAIMKQLAAGDHEADPFDGAALAEAAECKLNALLETIPTGGA